MKESVLSLKEKTHHTIEHSISLLLNHVVLRALWKINVHFQIAPKYLKSLTPDPLNTIIDDFRIRLLDLGSRKVVCIFHTSIIS